MEKQVTFTACSDLKRYDEKDFAALVVNHTAVQAHYIYPTLDELFECLPSLVWHQDEPFGSTSLFAQWMVFKRARQESTKVILDGEGADEQLAGYHGFFGNHFYDLFTSFKWGDLWKEMRIAKQKHGNMTPFPLLLNKLTPDWLRQPMRRWLGKTSSESAWIYADRLNAEPQDPFSNDLYFKQYV